MPPAAAPSAADLANKLADYNAHPVNSTDALNSALSQYGVPEIRQTVSGLRQTVANTTNALNNVDPSVTGRTQGSLVTEAQRQRQVANERAPIAQQLRDQTSALGQNEADLTSAEGQATQAANAHVHDYEAGRAALQQEYQDAFGREQAARAASASNDNSALLSALFGAASGSPAPSAPASPSATMTQRADKGFNFTDQNGNAINAAQYAHLTGQSFRSVLQKAADAGDLGSKTALNFVGDDFGYDPTKVTSQAQADLYKALTGQTANIYRPGTSPAEIVTGATPQVRQAALGNTAKSIMDALASIRNRNTSTINSQLAAYKAAHGGKI